MGEELFLFYITFFIQTKTFFPSLLSNVYVF